MLDYAIYEKSSRKSFAMLNPNPNPKSDHKNKIRFRIILYERNLDIVIYKDSSLEDLYIKIYNAVYPNFSTEKKNDIIPPSNVSTHFECIPKIHFVSVINANADVISIPFHRFITIDIFMKTKKEYFKNKALFGMPTFKIYVVDENFLEKSKNPMQKKSNDYVKKFLQCYTTTKNN